MSPARRTRAVPLGTIAGIPLRANASWLIIFALVLWSFSASYLPARFPEIGAATAWFAGLCATLLFFASLVGHELAHALVARRAGIPVAGVTLFLFGGVSRIEREPPDPGTELRVALVGPLSSFVLAGGFWALAEALHGTVSDVAVVVLRYLATINAALGVFNLIPGLPLDGGRVLRALVWRRTGSLRQATRLASNLGRGFALGLMLLGGLEILAGALVGGLWLVFIGLFLRATAGAGAQELAMRSALEGVDVEEVMVRDPLCVSPDLTLRELVDDHLLRDGVRGYPVCEGPKLLGTISLAQLAGLSRDQLAARRVRDAMLPLERSARVAPGESLLSALQKMTREGQLLLAVMDGERFVGIVTRGAIRRVLEVRRALGEIEDR